MNDATAARLAALPDPDRTPVHGSHADNILVAARWRADLAAMSVDPYGLAGNA